jgi:hypothetical protein
MARKTDHIAKLYEERRYHPRNAPHDKFPSPHRAANRCEPHEEVQENQFRENAHGPGYDNDVNKRSWLQSGNAEAKPSFDHWQNRPSMKRNKGNDWS